MPGWLTNLVNTFSGLPQAVQIAVVVLAALILGGLIYVLMAPNGLPRLFRGIGGFLGSMPRGVWTVVIIALVVFGIMKFFGGLGIELPNGQSLFGLKAVAGEPLSFQVLPASKTHGTTRVEGQNQAVNEAAERRGVNTLDVSLKAAGMRYLADPFSISARVAVSETSRMTETQTITVDLYLPDPVGITTTIGMEQKAVTITLTLLPAQDIPELLQGQAEAGLSDCRRAQARRDGMDAEVAGVGSYLTAWVTATNDVIAIRRLVPAGMSVADIIPALPLLEECAKDLINSQRWTAAVITYVKPPSAEQAVRDIDSVRAGTIVAMNDYLDLYARLDGLSDEEVKAEAGRQLSALKAISDSANLLYEVMVDRAQAADATHPFGFADTAKGYDQVAFDTLGRALSALTQIRTGLGNAITAVS